MTVSWPIYILFLRNLSWVNPRVSPHMLLYKHGPAILPCKYHKIIQVQNGRCTAIFK